MQPVAPSWTDVISALMAIAAFAVAWVAWTTSVNTLRTSYRPVLRVVPVRGADGQNDQAKLILKNIGLGPALSVVLLELHPTTPDGAVMAQLELVERLGESPDNIEGTRQGRIVMAMTSEARMQWQRHYRLLYQDIAGGWHETAFIFRQQDVQARLLGPRRWWHALNSISRVPKHVQTLAQVVRAPEML
jgi:hypothetical protein